MGDFNFTLSRSVFYRELSCGIFPNERAFSAEDVTNNNLRIIRKLGE
jgi:hypothetical protein